MRNAKGILSVLILLLLAAPTVADASSCSKWIVNPTLVGRLDCAETRSEGSAAPTGQTAAITTTSTIASAPAGLYRVAGYLHTTTAADGVCTSDVTIGWTYDSSAETSETVTNHDQNTDNNNSQFTLILRSDAAANITHAVSLDAGGGDCTNAEFDFFIVAEKVQ